jgi:uncharacterized iron-regulated membrane protein
MKKLCSKLHLWLAIPFGIFITVVCLTGALLVFEEEINHLTSPQLYYVEASGEAPMNPKHLAAQVAETLPEDVSVTGITVSDDPQKTWLVSLSKPRHTSVAVNPYTGEVLGRVERSAFFSKVIALHRFLLNAPRERGAMTVGKAIVGISVLVLVVVLITGIVMWAPRQLRALGSRLTISGKHGTRTFLAQLHHAGGMYALIFVLLMVLTGLTWSFGWYRTAFYALFDSNNNATTQVTAAAPHSERGEHPQGRGGNPNYQHAKHEGEGGNANYQHAQHEGNGNANYQHAQHEGNGAPNYQHAQHEGGRPNVAEITVMHDTDRPTTTQGWVYWIHTGKWGGIVTKIIYFLACLIGASLPLTGYYLWAVRKKRKH